MNKIKDWIDDIWWIVEEVIGFILLMIWYVICICVPSIILVALYELRLLQKRKCEILFTKYLNWWRKLLISPDDEAEITKLYDLVEKLEKNN